MDGCRTETAIAVFCGSSEGTGGPPVGEAVDRLVDTCTRMGVRIVFGGSDVGLMGRLARRARATGCAVTGVTPHHLAEVEPPALGVELVTVDTMAERKQRFIDFTDAVLVLPGGIGTLDEAFDAMTGEQLGLHRLPIVFVDIDGFWAPLRALVEHLRATGFIAPGRVVHFAPEIEEALGIALGSRAAV